MNINRRKQTRRDADHILMKTLEVLRLLEKISKGEDADYTEHFADLVGMKDRLGRRQEDRRLVELLCCTLESIVTNISKLLKKDDTFRKVRITKASGRPSAQFSTWCSFEGWEAEPPRRGLIYRIYKDDGGVLSTSPIVEVKSDYFQTANSMYRIEVL